MGHRIHVTVYLQRRARMELDFRKITLRRALEVIQRYTRSLWVGTEHMAGKDAVKRLSQDRIVWMLNLVALSFLVCMHDYCLDIWMYNIIIMTTLTLIRQRDDTTLTN